MSRITGYVSMVPMAVLEVFHHLQPLQLVTKTKDEARASNYRQKGIGFWM
jgi:hypothetical protein